MNTNQTPQGYTQYNQMTPELGNQRDTQPEPLPQTEKESPNIKEIQEKLAKVEERIAKIEKTLEELGNIFEKNTDQTEPRIEQEISDSKIPTIEENSIDQTLLPTYEQHTTTPNESTPENNFVPKDSSSPENMVNFAKEIGDNKDQFAEQSNTQSTQPDQQNQIPTYSQF